jgi:hypothetical protein
MLERSEPGHRMSEVEWPDDEFDHSRPHESLKRIAEEFCVEIGEARLVRRSGD